MSGGIESRKYRVEIKVPRVGLPKGRIAWKSLMVQATYTDVGDVADYFIESMELSGIDREVARTWVQTHLRCVPITTEVVTGDPEDMPTGP